MTFRRQEVWEICRMDFRDFFSALLGDWISLMSGIASVALMVVAFVRKWDKVPRWAFVIAAIACFFLASARAWTTEHRRAQSLKDEIDRQAYPQFSCEINQVSEVVKE